MTHPPCDNPDPPPDWHQRVKPLHDAWLVRHNAARARHAEITPYGWFVEGIKYAEEQGRSILEHDELRATRAALAQAEQERDQAQRDAADLMVLVNRTREALDHQLGRTKEAQQERDALRRLVGLRAAPLADPP